MPDRPRTATRDCLKGTLLAEFGPLWMNTPNVLLGGTAPGVLLDDDIQWQRVQELWDSICYIGVS
jgi:hypothetical protein